MNDGDRQSLLTHIDHRLKLPEGRSRAIDEVLDRCDFLTTRERNVLFKFIESEGEIDVQTLHSYQYAASTTREEWYYRVVQNFKIVDEIHWQHVADYWEDTGEIGDPVEIALGVAIAIFNNSTSYVPSGVPDPITILAAISCVVPQTPKQRRLEYVTTTFVIEPDPFDQWMHEAFKDPV